MSDLQQGLEAYLTDLWGAPTSVTNLSRIPGGASRETYRLDADTGGVTRGMILRRDPPGSLIETDRRLEFLAYRTVHGHVPVPQAIALEEGGGPLERPFFLMERIDGGTVPSPFVFDPYGEHAEALGRQFFTTLGRLAALNHEGTPIREVAPAPAPEDCWRIALDHWSGVIEADEQHPQPIVRAAVRWLYRHPPASPAGGDRPWRLPSRATSCTTGPGRSWPSSTGRWPIWAIRSRTWAGPSIRCGTTSTRARSGAWFPTPRPSPCGRPASGLKVDPEALAWWSLFNAVKGQAIWTSAAKEYRDGGFTDPILAISGWYTARRHDLILASRLAQLEGI